MSEPLKTVFHTSDEMLKPTNEQARQQIAETTHLPLPVEEPPVSFERAMGYVFQKNSELYERLA